ncbi:DUF4345 family protein [Streptosporangium lutulentum]
MATAVVIVMMVFFLAMGLYGLLVPAALIRPFGMIAGSAEARAEIRAVYGGSGWASPYCWPWRSPMSAEFGAAPWWPSPWRYWAWPSGG